MPVTASFVPIAIERFGSPYQYGNAAGTFQRGTNLYIVCSNPGQPQAAWNATVSGTPPPILAQGRVLKSIDGGSTWNEVDVDGGPAVSLKKSSTVFRGLYSPMGACYLDADTLLVAYWVWDYVYNNAVQLRFSIFDLITETWGVETTGGPTSTVVTNVGVSFRPSDGAAIFMYDGLENVAGTDYKRSFFVIYDAGFGVETAVDPAQTGDANDYSFAGVVPGDSSRTHFFYVIPDQAGLVPSIAYQATLTSADVLTARVQVTDQIKIANTGGIGPWTYAAPSTRLVSAATQLLFGYINDSDTFLFVAKATSANSPVFSVQQVDSNPSVNGPVGAFGAGLALSVGAAAAAIDTTAAELIATGSRDLITWDTPSILSAVPFAAPIVSNLNIFGLSGLFIDYTSGFYASGIVVNTNFEPPE